jgi:allantoinase
MTARSLDLVIKNVRLVRPGQSAVEAVDLGVKDGRFVAVQREIPVTDAREIFDAKGLLGFPGLVDAHTHAGIYSPLADDAVTESKAAVTGGVTAMLTYVRTGQYYLNRGGAYRDFFPEVLRQSAGRYWCDYAYHVAPIERAHIDEIEMLAVEHGVPSFKIFMFYGGYGLHGSADSAAQRKFLMLPEDESYDLAHFEFVMRGAARLIERRPMLRDYVSVSLHCELADILNAYTRIVQDDPSLTGLAAYGAARPPHAEGLAVWVAAYLANEAACPNINLLHLSSGKAMEAALAVQRVFPHIDFRREVTVGHLLLDTSAPVGALAKVNPPIRPRADVEHLWRTVLEGEVSWIVSDHACCATEMKVSSERPDDIWLAKSGFGGTEYLLSGVFSEGSKRGLPYHRMAELCARNPAQRYGLLGKGDVAPGYDADLALLDPNQSFTVRATDSPSGEGYTPFEGHPLPP